jgi:outer membrane protein assembly factor BamB
LYRGSALILLTLILLISNIVIIPQHPKTLNNLNSDDEMKFSPGPTLIRPTRAGSPWPMYLKTPLHESYTTDSGPITNNLLWSTSTSGLTYGSDNGTLAWRTPTIAPVHGGYGVSSSPAVVDGCVFFGGDRFYCLYANNGTIKWTVDDPGNQEYGDGLPTVVNGKVFIGGSDRRLYCIEQETGNVLWRTQAFSGGAYNYGLFAAPSVINGHVYLAACNGYIYKINESGQPSPPSDATINHSFNSGRCIYSAPVIANGRVYFGNGYYSSSSTSNKFYCLNATDLSLIWEFSPGSTSFFCSAGYYDDKVYVGSRSGSLYCLDAIGSGGSTTVLWEFDQLGDTWSSPAITKDRLYVGSKSGYLYCFNLSQPASPDYYWRYNTGDNIDSTPAITDGRLYVGSQSGGGNIYCFGAPVTIDRIEIESMPGGIGSEISDNIVDVGTIITGHAAAYNKTNYLYDIQVNWSLTNLSSANASTQPTFSVTSSDFYSGFYGGIAIWTADDGQGHIDSVTITINPPNLDYIVIRNGSYGTGTWVGDSTYLNGNNDTFFSAGYNATTGWFEDIPALWSSDNPSVGDIEPGPFNSTFFNALYYGKCNITAEYGPYSNSTGMLSVYTSTILKYGWNLISVPLIQAERNLDNVLSSIAGKYDAVQRYDAMDVNDSWKHNKIDKSFGNDLFEIDETMGFWIHITTPGDTIFIHNGSPPTENQTIELQPGWNLIGYSSRTEYDRTEGLNNLAFGSEVDSIWTYDATIQEWKEMDLLSYFEIGKGYFIHANVEVAWEIPL